MMDSFDNFQYDSASSYGGGISVVDDNSSVYTASTNTGTPVDLESLSIVDDRSQTSNGRDEHHHHTQSITLDEEFDAVLDDLKDEGAMDLPPHACR
jgi:regulator of nonsense transcripts 1